MIRTIRGCPELVSISVILFVVVASAWSFSPGNPLLNGCITREGGMASLFRACEPMSHGHVVQATVSANLGVSLSDTSSQSPLGVVYFDASGSASVSSGAWVWVVTCGICDVFVDGAVSSRTVLTTSATTRGYSQGQAAVPPVTVAEHNGEIGHILMKTTGAGLASAVLHFN
jgi:hypothetical protein